MSSLSKTLGLLVAVAGIVVAIVLIPADPPAPAAPATTEKIDSSISATAATVATTTRNPQLFDVTLFKGKPASGLGMRTDAALIYGNDGSVWTDQAKLTAAVRSLVADGASIIILDNESRVTARLIEIVRWARAAAPDKMIGVYDYPSHAFFKTQAENRAINDESQELLKMLDVALPSCYTVFGLNSRATYNQWSTNLSLTIAECARVMPKKPIYPFLQMYYPPEAISNQFELIGSPYFLREVQECMAKADGAMLWSGPLPWDSTASWHRDLRDAKLLKPAAATTAQTKKEFP